MQLLFFMILFVAVLCGNFGGWLYCYNRINATGFRRKTIKRVERLFVLLSFVIPLVVLACDSQRLFFDEWIEHLWQEWKSFRAPCVSVWSALSLVSLAVLGPWWLTSRLYLIPPKNLVSETTTRFDMEAETGQRLTKLPIAEFCRRIPLNEMLQLTVTEKVLRLRANRARAWEPIRIGHLSDIHFTGQIDKPFYQFAFQRIQQLQPDMIVVSGDIIDADACLDWISELLGPLAAPMGRYFVIGNHEQRLSHIQPAIERLVQSRWIDLGAGDAIAKPTRPGLPTVRLTGNELPWYSRRSSPQLQMAKGNGEAVQHELWIGVSHSPDQFAWACKQELDLMLAGHTHGGQIRVPGIGPIVSPSWYGSTFASGVFALNPTLMHVSRGMAGCHPLRWRCPPEVSLLTILPA